MIALWKKLNLDSIVGGGGQCRHPLSCLICESSAHLLAIASIHLLIQSIHIALRSMKVYRYCNHSCFLLIPEWDLFFNLKYKIER